MSGSSQAIHELYLRQHRSLLGYLRSKLSSLDDAEEVAQEAYARLLELDSTHGIERLQGYLFRIAANLVIDRARQQCVRDRHEPADPFEQVPALPEPERAAIAGQALRAVLALVVRMPERRRHAFAQFVLCDRTASQVAAEMGVSVKAIEKHVAQARVHCRQVLAQEKSRCPAGGPSQS